MRCNKEALLALMQPFLVFPNGGELDRLLHHKNTEGQNLLAYVAHHNKVWTGSQQNGVKTFLLISKNLATIFSFWLMGCASAGHLAGRTSAGVFKLTGIFLYEPVEP